MTLEAMEANRPMIDVRSATPQDIPVLGRLMAEALDLYDMPVTDDAEITRALAAQLPAIEMTMENGRQLALFA
jgi:hypothetical protein